MHRPIMKSGRMALMVCLLITSFHSRAQTTKAYSDPVAPVGDKALTVPPSVTPIMDHWMRDTYVMNGPDGYYYMTGTTATPDRKSTRLNSSHSQISYAVFCLKKKNTTPISTPL